MAQTDISDTPIVRPQGNQDTTLNLLPTRGEKHLLPTSVSQVTSSQQRTGTLGLSAQTVIQTAEKIAAALEPLTDFITVRIQNRGTTSSGNPDPKQDAVYRFLINPAQVQINHTMLDAQAYARAGWQFGVWGEDFVRISLTGKTAGQYFALGITDTFAEYTESFRNLEMLIDTFENNGYWFEGEQAYGNTNAINFTRRPIKMHQDVILTCKEFIWYGMFESLEVSQDADAPFYATYTLSFIAWKERFRSDSPYYNEIQNATQRGNAYQVYANLATPSTTSLPFPQTGLPTSLATTPPQPGNATTAGSPVQQAEQAQNTFTTLAPTAISSAITQPILNTGSPTETANWLGVQN